MRQRTQHAIQPLTRCAARSHVTHKIRAYHQPAQPLLPLHQKDPWLASCMQTEGWSPVTFPQIRQQTLASHQPPRAQPSDSIHIWWFLCRRLASQVVHFWAALILSHHTTSHTTCDTRHGRHPALDIAVAAATGSWHFAAPTTADSTPLQPEVENLWKGVCDNCKRACEPDRTHHGTVGRWFTGCGHRVCCFVPHTHCRRRNQSRVSGERE